MSQKKTEEKTDKVEEKVDVDTNAAKPSRRISLRCSKASPS